MSIKVGLNPMLGHPKIPLQINGNIPECLDALQKRLVIDGQKALLAFLPRTDNMVFIEQAEIAKQPVKLYLGKYKGLVYVYPDGTVLRLSAGNLTTTPVTQEDSLYPPFFSPPAPFGWDSAILQGLRMPLDERSLVLTQYYSLVWAFDSGHLDKHLPVPDYGSLLSAFQTLEKTDTYRKQLELDPDRVVHFEMFELDRYQFSSSKAAESDSEWSLFYNPSDRETTDYEEMYTPECSQPDTPKLNQPVRSQQTQNLDNRFMTDADSSSVWEGAVESDHQHTDARSVAAAHQLRQDSIDTDDTSVEFPAGHHALAFLKRQITPRNLSVLEKLEGMLGPFSEHDKGEFADIRLWLGNTTWNKAEGKIWAYLTPSGDSDVGPTMTLQVEYQLEGSRQIRTIPVGFPESVQAQVSEMFDLQHLLEAMSAQSIDELLAVVKYGFMLAAEAEVLGFDEYLVPVTKAFKEDLDRFCGRLRNSERTANRSEGESSASTIRLGGSVRTRNNDSTRERSHHISSPNDQAHITAHDPALLPTSKPLVNRLASVVLRPNRSHTRNRKTANDDTSLSNKRKKNNPLAERRGGSVQKGSLEELMAERRLLGHRIDTRVRQINELRNLDRKLERDIAKSLDD